MLAPTRRAAAELRERITGRLNRTAREPIARTPASLAFGILRRAAARRGPAGAPAALRPGAGRRAARAARRSRRRRRPGPGLAGRRPRRAAHPWPARRAARPDDARGRARPGRRPTWPGWAARTTGPSGWPPRRCSREYDEVNGAGQPRRLRPGADRRRGRAGPGRRPDLLADVRRCARFVAVDDAQEMTPAVAELLAAVVGSGRRAAAGRATRRGDARLPRGRPGVPGRAGRRVRRPRGRHADRSCCGPAGATAPSCGPRSTASWPRGRDRRPGWPAPGDAGARARARSGRRPPAALRRPGGDLHRRRPAPRPPPARACPGARWRSSCAGPAGRHPAPGAELVRGAGPRAGDRGAGA